MFAPARLLRQLSFLTFLTLTGLTGILFADCSEVAYSAMRMWQALGLVICFTTAEVVSFHARVLVFLGTVILAGIVNLIVEFTTQPKEELFPCVYRKRKNILPSNSSSTKLTQDAVKEPIDKQFSIHKTAGQNPIFIVYEGHRPSVSTLSGDSLESDPPLAMNLTSFKCNGHRSRLNLDSCSQELDERLTSKNYSRSTPLFAVSSGKTLSSLDSIRECEESGDHPSINIDPHKVSIQRSPSYLNALNNIVTVDDDAQASYC